MKDKQREQGIEEQKEDLEEGEVEDNQIEQEFDY